MIICDEPVSALDVSVQAQILNLLEDMKARYGLTLIFIAHDLAVVKNVSDRVAVMYLGKVCEVGSPDDLYATPAHPYTAALLRRSRCPTRRSPPVQSGSLTGDLPSPIDPPSGCRFRTRCPLAQERCAVEEPHVRAVAEEHFVACHFPLVGTTAPEATPVEVGTAGTATPEAHGHATRPRNSTRRSSWTPRQVCSAGGTPSDVGFEEVAEAAGVSRSLVYAYFGDRGGLIAAVYLHNLDQLDRELGKALDDRLPDAVRLRRLIRRYLVFARDNEAAWNVMAAAGSLQHPAIQAARRERDRAHRRRRGAAHRRPG